MQKELQQKIDTRTKPIGSLGMLEEIALKIGLVQKTLTPTLEKPTMFVFAADHGIVDERVSISPKETTWQMVLNFLNDGAAINVFCRQNGINISVVDAGVDFDFEPHDKLIIEKVAYGTKNMLHEPAMSSDECTKALDTGARLVREAKAKGSNVIGFGEMGIANTSASALLMHKFTGISVADCTGVGAGLTPEGLEHKVAILTQVAERYRELTDPFEILCAVGGLEIAMICGGMIEAAKQEMIILVDGFIASNAFLYATKQNPDILQNAIFCHRSNEKGHALLLEHLGVKGVLDLGMRLGEGSGAAVAYPVIKSAITFLNEMASFESAQVSLTE